MNNPKMNQDCDVAIVGGGPAGSTAAYSLAKAGWKVTLFEKAQHPRFHIGESLLPMNLPLFERVGVMDQVAKIGVYKPGAEFYDPDPTRPPHRFYFRDSLDKAYPDAYQIRRDQLDNLLLRNCQAAGAQVLEQARVQSVEISEQGSSLSVQQGGELSQWRARYLIDASGRDTLLANHFQIKRKNARHASAAIFGHFKGVPRNPGENSGLISVCWFEHGWIWFIPLPDDVMSIGAVCNPDYLKTRKTSPAEFLMHTLRHVPKHVQERVAQAELIGEARATGNYSYQCSRMCFPGAILIGDAYAFVDPVFSSGVLLGMRSAFNGADYVDALLRGDRSAAQKRRHFEKQTRRSIVQFSWMISRFNSPGIRHLFMNPGNPFRVQEAVTSLLAGDIDRPNGVYPRLLFFRTLYYFFSALKWREALREWRVRRARARVEFRGGTSEVDTA